MELEKTLPSDGNFQSYYEKANDLLEIELQTLLPTLLQLKLQKQVEYALHTKGKRLRSTMVFLSGESVGGSKPQLQKLALAIELLHLATLVHDDVLDEDLRRRDSFSVHVRWSVKEAILVGDVLASLAFALCKGYSREILDLMIDACLQLSDGEYSDVEILQSTLTKDEYFKKIGKKCASLFAVACESAGIAVDCSRAELTALKFFGKDFGFAYQIRDDILDLQALGNDVQPEISKFRLTLPIIHTYECMNKEKQAFLKKLRSKQNPDDLFVSEELTNFLKEFRVTLENNDSLRYCARMLDYYVDSAIERLGPLKSSAYKTYLVEMAESLRLNKSP